MSQEARIFLGWLPVLILSLLATGCGEQQSGACAENESATCLCAGPTIGYKFCTPEGVFSECECTESSLVGTGGIDDFSSTAAGSAASGQAIDPARDAGGVTSAPATSGADGNTGVAAAGSAGSDGIADATLPQAEGSVSTTYDAGAAREASTAGSGGSAGTGGAPTETGLDPFSFFVVSYEAMQRLSGSQNGFGGDLRYGETTGIAGADKICTEVAESSMKGAAQKGWRAFLSATTGGENGGPIHAIERIGPGPWYDRLGRTVALSISDLQNTRPLNADSAIVNDLPNEHGVPNSEPDGVPVDNHHVLTGSNEQGRLAEDNARITCQDWTSAVGADGQPRVGFSWPRGGGFGSRGGGGASHWISGFNAAGCAAVVNLVQDGPGDMSTLGVGSGGGYGAIYCFALLP